MHEGEIWQLYYPNGEAREGEGRPAEMGNPGADEEDIVGAISVFLYRQRSDGLEFLWQKRAENLTDGGKWVLSTTGHVNLGETFPEAAIRELYEEIGAVAEESELELYFEHRLHNGMFARHYLANFDDRAEDYAFVFNDGEVTETRWVPYSEMDGFRRENAKDSLKNEEGLFVVLAQWLRNKKLVPGDKVIGEALKERGKKNYAFIDGNNLYLGAKSQGLKLDYKIFRLFLKNKYNVEKAFIFVGHDVRREKLYSYFRKCGFELVFKPTVKFTQGDKTIMKGNVDAELVLHTAAIEYENYNRAIIVTGDGDFACLAKFLKENDKLEKIIAPTPEYSSLLRPYGEYILQLKTISGGVLAVNKSTGLAANILDTNQAGTVAGIRGRSKP